MRHCLPVIFLAAFSLSCQREVSGGSGGSRLPLLVRSVGLDTAQGTISFDSTDFSYDAGRKLVLESNRFGVTGDVITQTTRYDRDAAGRTIHLHSDYLHTRNGQVIQSPFEVGSQQHDAWFSYADATSRKISYSTVKRSETADLTADSTRYTYGANGRLSASRDVRYPSGPDSLKDIIINQYSYDPAGNILTYDTRGNDPSSPLAYSFTYDDKKNPLFFDEDVFEDWERTCPNNILRFEVDYPVYNAFPKDVYFSTYTYRADGLADAQFTPGGFTMRFYYE